ncbi:MAG TPA: LLM class flavin-dependent oxidoreductase [Bryobacteraceae bacterium]|jgi:luciferase family oxidoreductase group 1|nr:LLM class flavin-dependent oxidoreductase [Bryobacteraceae bacterium]
MKPPAISVLDLAIIHEYETHAQALQRSIGFAKEIEGLGYFRHWIPEHHAVSHMASVAPAILMAAIASATHSIRVGAGGVMLLNHSPLIVAEQFGTLSCLFPGRIDLGMGRAVGSEKAKEKITRKALGRKPEESEEEFEERVRELTGYLGRRQQAGGVDAGPGENSDVELFILSSTGQNAKLAAKMGLPFAFAAHLSEKSLVPSLEVYRNHFRSSAALDKPYVILSVFALAAEHDEQARTLFSSMEQMMLGSIRNSSAKLVAPVKNMNEIWTPQEESVIGQRVSIVGGKTSVRNAIAQLVERTGVDELMIVCDCYEYSDRVRSHAILTDAVASL